VVASWTLATLFCVVAGWSGFFTDPGSPEGAGGAGFDA